MTYIIAYQHAYNRTSEQWHGSLDRARAHAKNFVRSGAADSVEISDPQGRFVQRVTGDPTADTP